MIFNVFFDFCAKILMFGFMFLGDVNGDGCDDLVIGAINPNDRFAGSVFVVFGSHLNTMSVVNVDQFEYTAQGYAIQGIVNSWFGYSVSGAGNLLVKLGYFHHFNLTI